ncbi:hypothetical protein Dimus_028939 [Dionaea muscipula]
MERNRVHKTINPTFTFEIEDEEAIQEFTDYDSSIPDEICMISSHLLSCRSRIGAALFRNIGTLPQFFSISRRWSRCKAASVRGGNDRWRSHNDERYERSVLSVGDEPRRTDATSIGVFSSELSDFEAFSGNDDFGAGKRT